jgi:hypothetical protein
MSKQSHRRRRARCAVARAIAIGGAVATLAVILATGQALAGVAPPDERVLERQGRIDHETVAGQQQAEERRGQAPVRVPRRFFPPEPPMSTESRLGIDQLAPAPPKAPERAGPSLALPVVLAALVLALAALSTWRIRHRPARPGTHPTT